MRCIYIYDHTYYYHTEANGDTYRTIDGEPNTNHAAPRVSPGFSPGSDQGKLLNK